MAAQSLSPNSSFMLAVRPLSVVFIPEEGSSEESHLPLARLSAFTVRFCKVELQRRTAAKVLKKGSSKSPGKLALVTDAIVFRAFATIAAPPSGNKQVD
jgi:hypothetical protein